MWRPMPPQRWQRIEEIFHAALECAPQQRSAFIDKACDGDTNLRSEILDLVRREEASQGHLLDRPAWNTAAESQPTELMSLPVPGSRLGPYEITSPIGAGGMGQVFQARDTRLDRTV